MGIEEDRRAPVEPLGFIRKCVALRRIQWTYHVNMRLAGRFIPRLAIVESVGAYELIEAYPDDKYLPSYLIFSRHEDFVFHVLFAADVAGDNVRVITAYRPAPEEWEPDLKTRRRKK